MNDNQIGLLIIGGLFLIVIFSAAFYILPFFVNTGQMGLNIDQSNLNAVGENTNELFTVWGTVINVNGLLGLFVIFVVIVIAAIILAKIL